MKHYEVTIGIPVYNIEKYVRLSMDSALAQTFGSIEFLVLDDCGTDSSMDIVRDYQQNHPRGKDIRIVRQPQNMGLGRARNRIIEEAQGTWLYHLDGDDAMSPDAIQLLHEQAVKYDADMVYGSYERIEEFGSEVKRTQHVYEQRVFLGENEFADRVYSDYAYLQASTWNFLIKTDLYRKNKLRHKAVNYWEDFSFTIDLPNYVTRVVMLPNITYSYYCRMGSLSNFGRRDTISRSEVQKTLDAMALVKSDSLKWVDKPYFHKRMYKVMVTHFYMACTLLKDERRIVPPYTQREVRDIMRSPLSLAQVLRLKGWRTKNLFLYLLGVLPPACSVTLMRMTRK